MWRADGSPKEQRPTDWLATVQATAFVENLRKKETTGVAGSLITTKEGRGGGTWAHRQIAIE
jgi:hypothetical protein